MTTAENTPTARLNPMQQAFCRNYVANGGNASRAYEDAGYSANGANGSASRLLANASIQAEIAKIRRDVEKSESVDRAYVTAKLVDFAENGEKESNRLRATEMLGKSVRMFVDVQTTAVAGNGESELKKYTIDELVAIRNHLFRDQSASASDSEESVPVETTARMIEGGGRND